MEKKHFKLNIVILNIKKCFLNYLIYQLNFKAILIRS